MKLQKFDYQIDDKRKKKFYVVLIIAILMILATVIFYNSFANYKVTESYRIISGKVEPFVIDQIQKNYFIINNSNNTLSTNVIPSSAKYSYNETNSSCISGTPISCNRFNNEVTITSLNNEICNIYYNEISDVSHSINEAILRNGFISESPDFTTIESGKNNLYKYQTDLGYTYFYRGLNDNNYIKLGTDKDGNDIIWRIIRINEDGSVRLIHSTSIGKSPYQSVLTGNIFEYQTSEIKGFVDEWYLTTSLPSLLNNGILIDGNFYNDTEEYITEESGAVRYEPRHRAWANMGLQTPNLTRTDHLVTVANGKLTHPIAIPSVDDALLSGVVQGINSNNNSIYYGNSWTMSAGTFTTGGAIMPVLFGQTFGNDGQQVSYFVRPVINVAGNLMINGFGTNDEPYYLTPN